jgi:hypothetical protein
VQVKLVESSAAVKVETAQEEARRARMREARSVAATQAAREEHEAAAAAAAAVSRFCACIGSLCLRHCVHGAPIGGGGAARAGAGGAAAGVRQGCRARGDGAQRPGAEAGGGGAVHFD